MGNIRRRLEALEELVAPQGLQEWSDWELQDQLENVFDTLRFFQRHHIDGAVRYQATDREVHLLGLLCALWELGGTGEHRYPSGVVVEWTEEDNDGMQGVQASGTVSLKDLPEDVRRVFKRMDPVNQKERDLWLYNDRHRAKKDRERVRWHEEHGWDKPTPEYLRTWGEGGR